MPKSLKAVIEEATTHHLYLKMVSAWAKEDLASLAQLMADKIVRSVNVDPLVAPFAASAIGKAAYVERLQLSLQKFEFGAHVIDHLHIDGNKARGRIKTIWTDRATGERLKTSHTAVVTQHKGVIVRLDKYCDARYLEAFARFTARPNQHDHRDSEFS